MLNHVTRRRGFLAVLFVAGILAVTAIMFIGFATTAGAAALRTPYSLAGASGTGNNAPPVGSLPFNSKVWDAKNYRIVHHAADCPQPPKSDAARLALVNSPLVLESYGLPTLAMYGGNLAKWQRIVSHMRTRVCDSTVPIKNGHLILNNGGSNPNNIWGGYGNICTSGCWSYQAADAEFYVPAIDSSINTGDSIWVGTGGGNGGGLAQAGVSEDSTFGNNSYHAFYESEHCDGTSGEQDAYSVKPGDLMYVYANVYGNYTLNDYTNGQYHSYSRGCSRTDTVEFIVERNELQCCQADLANYHSVTWYYAEFEDASSTWRRVDSQGSLYTWWLVNGFNIDLETQGSISNDGYGSQWTETWRYGS